MTTDNEKLFTLPKRRSKLWWQVPFLIFLVIGTFYIVRQQRSTPFQKGQGFVFGTIYNVTYQYDKNLREEIEEELKRLDLVFSMFNDSSMVTKVNRGENPTLDETFVEVYDMATTVNRETEGAFDITVGPLVNAWGFGFKNEVMPGKAQVDSLLALVGMQKLTLDREKLRLTKSDERVTLDFSAIAKGYGSDCVARLLQKHGVKNYMVEIGGEVVTNGISPSRVPWRVGVSKPVEDSLQTSKELQTVLNVTDLSMATSGNYRNFYYKGGRKYAHTIDPQTGYPVQHSILSATVLAKSCALADAYATSFMVLGLEKAKQVLERHPELMAYFIYSDAKGDYAVWYSPSLKEKIND
jgi:thiamine biosynthesis lipoprotein